ncbi:MAG: acetylxylan esterase [bacterium]|nr:acetylxylan esterase [bacterium]
MTTFFDTHQLANPIQSTATGAHTLWIWSQEGAGAKITLAGRTFHLPTRSPSRLFRWVKAGRVTLRKDRRYTLGLDNPSPVAAIALSSSPRFDPEDSFKVSRIFRFEPNPIPDARLVDIRHVHTPWTLRTYNTLEAWQARAAEIRQHILVTLGLYPLPVKTPLRPQIFNRIERDGYSVEKVFFESLPGFFVCGNLYRPLAPGPHPGIACPHGHCRNGRLEDDDNAFASIPGRCISLARQGHVAFSYDMAGYNDSSQVEHRGFGGPREDLWGIGLMGLQTWNSIRAVDFLQSLPDVDPNRIGCTGASGGGTQTFMLAAVDDRVQVAAPVNMISAHMQGGCNCENQGNLRLDINNIEIAACMAPRPLFLVSASGDWTVNTPQLEYPAIRDIYRLFNAEDRVASAQVDAGHNYNRESREHVYAWFGKWLLNDNHPRHFKEQPFTVEPAENLLVFHSRKRPKRALTPDGLRQALIQRSQKPFQSPPKDRRSLNQFKKQMTPAYQHALNASYPERVTVDHLGQIRQNTFRIQRLLLGRPGKADRIPALLFTPNDLKRKAPATLVVHPQGKAALADLARGVPGSLVRSLLDRNHLVLAIDPFLTGEHLTPSGPATRDTRVSHFATYNPTDTACRIQDILTSLAYLADLPKVKTCHLIGLEAAGPWCLLARPLAPCLTRTAVDFNRFQADNDTEWVQNLYLPAIRTAGDFYTATALTAPGSLLVHNTGKHFPTRWTRTVYRSASKSARSALFLSEKRLVQIAVLDWVSK